MSLYAYILGCSVTTCDEPVREDFGLETLKYRRDLYELKWYRKVKHMNDDKLSFKLFSNEWNKAKSKGRSQKCWLATLILRRKN